MINYNELPEELKQEMFKRHRHMDLPNNNDCIVYTEQDVLELFDILIKI